MLKRKKVLFSRRKQSKNHRQHWQKCKTATFLQHFVKVCLKIAYFQLKKKAVFLIKFWGAASNNEALTRNKLVISVSRNFCSTFLLIIFGWNYQFKKTFGKIFQKTFENFKCVSPNFSSIIAIFKSTFN